MSDTLGEELYRISAGVPCDSAVKDFVDMNIINKYSGTLFQEANKGEYCFKFRLPNDQVEFFRKGYSKIIEYITGCYKLYVRTFNYENGNVELELNWSKLDPTVGDCVEFKGCNYPREDKFSYR